MDLIRVNTALLRDIEDTMTRMSIERAAARNGAEIEYSASEDVRTILEATLNDRLGGRHTRRYPLDELYNGWPRYACNECAQAHAHSLAIIVEDGATIRRLPTDIAVLAPDANEEATRRTHTLTTSDASTETKAQFAQARVGPERGHGRRSSGRPGHTPPRHIVTRAEGGAIRLYAFGEAASLEISNGYGDGPVHVHRRKRLPATYTMNPVAGIVITVHGWGVGISDDDWSFGTGTDLPPGHYSVALGGHNGLPVVQLIACAAPAGERAQIRCAPASGAWSAHIEDITQRSGWLHSMPLSLRAEGADCELALGEVNVEVHGDEPLRLRGPVRGGRREPSWACVKRGTDGTATIQVGDSS